METDVPIAEERLAWAQGVGLAEEMWQMPRIFWAQWCDIWIDAWVDLVGRSGSHSPVPGQKP
ncbi:hypothetical protein [Sphingomonas oryzagri]